MIYNQHIQTMTLLRARGALGPLEGGFGGGGGGGVKSPKETFRL